MEIFLVLYGDWEYECQIKGVFTDKAKAEMCEKYCQKVIDEEIREHGPFGQHVAVRTFDVMDDVDFESMIRELEEQERKRQQAIEDDIREADMAEFYRIKAKYGL